MKIRTYTAILSCMMVLLTGCGSEHSNTTTSSADSADDYIVVEDLTGIYETVPYSDAQTAVLSQRAELTEHWKHGLCRAAPAMGGCRGGGIRRGGKHLYQ